MYLATCEKNEHFKSRGQDCVYVHLCVFMCVCARAWVRMCVP